MLLQYYQSALDVSIHAPVQGATLQDITKEDAMDVSIHAPVQGATNDVFFPGQPGCFNPRSCTRSDAKLHRLGLFRRVSIHAPVQGATIDTP